MRSIWRKAVSSCSLLNSGTVFTGASSVAGRRIAVVCVACLGLATAMGLLDNRGRELGQWPPFPLEHFQEKWNPVSRLYSRQRAQRNAATVLTLSPLEHEREVAGIGVIEQQARALVEQVGIDIVGFQQRDPPLPNRALGLDGIELQGQLRDILVEIPLGDQSVFARIGIDPEIADEQRRDRVERECVEEAAEPSARDHGTKVMARR